MSENEENECTIKNTECCHALYDFYNITDDNFREKKKDFRLLTHPDKYNRLSQDDKDKLENLKLKINSNDVFKFKHACFDKEILKHIRTRNVIQNVIKQRKQKKHNA